MSDTTRPATRTRPLVGHVTREISFSSVVLPAPLRPITPTPAPSRTSKLTSRSAQMVESTFPRVALWTSRVLPRNRSRFDATRSVIVRERPARYRLVTRSSRIDDGVPALDDIGEVLVHPLEHDKRRSEHHG